MRTATKALMITNARGGNQGGGNRGGRSEMEMGGSEMRGSYQGGQNEARNGGYGEMCGNYPREAYGEMRGGYGRSEMRRGGVQSEMEMRRGGGRSEMRNEGGQSEMRGEGGDNRIGYEVGGNARSEMEEMEARRRYRRDRRGRFRSEMDDEETEQEMGMHYPVPFPPPIYEEQYRNPIGFSAEGGGAELHMIRGGASSHEKPLDKKTAEEWMEGLENEDGSKGPHWSMEQVKQLMAQKGWKEDPVRAWVALNIMYSDYCGVAKKVNSNNIEFYVAMAKAFLEDKDAGAKDKLSAYYENIVK